MPGGVGDVAQRALTRRARPARAPRTRWGTRCRRGAAGEHAGVDQLVECGAELTQRRAVPPGPVVWDAVGVLLRHGERGGEQPRFLAGELQVRGADRAPAGGGPRRDRRACRAPGRRRRPSGRRARPWPPRRPRRGARPGRRSAGRRRWAPRPPSGSPHGAPRRPGRRSGPARAPRRPGRRGRRPRGRRRRSAWCISPADRLAVTRDRITKWTASTFSVNVDSVHLIRKKEPP